MLLDGRLKWCSFFCNVFFFILTAFFSVAEFATLKLFIHFSWNSFCISLVIVLGIAILWKLFLFFVFYKEGISVYHCHFFHSLPSSLLTPAPLLVNENWYQKTKPRLFFRYCRNQSQRQQIFFSFSALILLTYRVMEYYHYTFNSWQLQSGHMQKRILQLLQVYSIKEKLLKFSVLCIRNYSNLTMFFFVDAYKYPLTHCTQ